MSADIVNHSPVMTDVPRAKERTANVVHLYGGPLVGELLVSRAAEGWIVARFRRGEIKQTTMRRHRAALRTFVAVVGDRPIRSLTRRHVEKWLAHMVDDGWESTTRRTEWGIVHGFTQWARDEGHLARDPFRNLKPPKKERRLPRPLDDVAVSTLVVEAPDERAVAVLALSIGCGLRAMEIAGARVQDWNRVTDLLRVIGKGGHERHVPIVPVVAQALDRYLTTVGYPSSGPLIRSRRNPHHHLAPATITMYWSRWATAAGVKRAGWDGVSSHSGRHTAATKVFQATGDPRAVQLLLGHADLSHVMVYSAAIELERLRQALTDVGAA